MSFEISKERPPIKDPVRVREVKDMLEQLNKDPANLTAKIDMAASNVRRYAHNQGYNVRAKKIDDRHCYVWIDIKRTHGKVAV